MRKYYQHSRKNISLIKLSHLNNEGVLFIKVSEYYNTFLWAIRQLALWIFSEMWTDSQLCKTATWPYINRIYGKNTISLHALGKHTTITPATLQTRHSLKNRLNKTASSFAFFVCVWFQEASIENAAPKCWNKNVEMFYKNLALRRYFYILCRTFEK